MTDTSTPVTERSSHPPLWLVEGLDIVEQRRSVLIAVTVGVIALGGILALVAPGLVPPRPLVGVAVGLAAILLGLAVAVALDATDLRLRGPRHVGAAGGELVAVLPTRAERAGAETLAGSVLEARAPGAPLLLGLAASGRDVRPTVAWTDALATALQAEGVSVLRIDLASGHTSSAGLLEVVRDGVKMISAVTFGPGPKLARLGAGADLAGALGALSALPGRLPRDLDVLLVALPMAATRPVVTAVRSLDHVLIVAQRDRTSRVELIAGLDAMEAAGTRAQVALLDDRTAARLAPRSVAPDPGSEPDEPQADVEDDATTEAGEPAGSQPSEDEPGTAPGLRLGAALGVGGAALTAAGVAVAFAARGSGADGEPGEPDAPPADEDDEAVRAIDEPHSDASDRSTRDERPAREPSQRRDVEVVHGAAEAAAIALVQLPVEPPFEAEADGAAPVTEGALPVGGEQVRPAESAPDLPPAPVTLKASDDPDDPHEGDMSEPFASKMRLTEDSGQATAADDAEHDEMMRSTAQLSVLLEDVGGDEPPPDTP